VRFCAIGAMVRDVMTELVECDRIQVRFCAIGAMVRGIMTELVECGRIPVRFLRHRSDGSRYHDQIGGVWQDSGEIFAPSERWSEVS
jgi:hypothetical protein